MQFSTLSLLSLTLLLTTTTTASPSPLAYPLAYANANAHADPQLGAIFEAVGAIGRIGAKAGPKALTKGAKESAKEGAKQGGPSPDPDVQKKENSQGCKDAKAAYMRAKKSPMAMGRAGGLMVYNTDLQWRIACGHDGAHGYGN